MNGAELFVACLRQQGVEWVSGLCGNGLNSILAACHAAGVRVIDTRNEQTAGYMAESWGRLSGQVGVCLASSGVAHVNAMAGVLNAHFDGAPMLLVTGAGPLQTAGRGHFQDLDQVALAAPVCKYARLVDAADRIPELVHDAFAAAIGGRPGPVHLTMPMDVLSASTSAAPCRRVVRPSGAHPSAEILRSAVDMLSASRRPLLVAGSGAFYSGAEEAIEGFCAAYGIPLMVPIWDRGTVVQPCAEYMGVVGAATGDPEVLERADLLILAGAELDYRLAYGQPNAADRPRIMRIEMDAARLARGPCDLPILADPVHTMRELDAAAAARGVSGYEDWLRTAEQLRNRFTERIRAGVVRQGDVTHAIDILDAFQTVLPAEAVLVVDGGNIGQWFHQTLGRRQYPAHWLTCGASGVVGFGLGGAMAARAGFPSRPVVLLSGDGSATFTLTDLERAVGQDLPVVMVVADDQRWGIVASGQEPSYGQPLNSILGAIDFVAVAEALGAMGVRVESADQLAPALQEALTQRRPVLLHVPISGGIPGA